MQRTSQGSSHRPPLSPRSALRSLQDPEGSSGTAHETHHSLGPGGPHPQSGVAPSIQRTLLGLRPGSSPEIASRSQSLFSPTSLIPGEPRAQDLVHSGLRPSTSATTPGYSQHPGWGNVEPRAQHMFAPESVFTASNRQVQQQSYLPPTTSQPPERHQAGGSTPSYASMYPPRHSQTLSRSLDRNFQHSQFSLPTLPSITEPFRASQHSDRYPGTQRYDDESSSTYSANTPRASVSTSLATSARSSQSQYSGHSFSHELYSPQELLMPAPHRLSSSASQRAYLPMPPRRTKPARSFDDYLAPLNQAAFGSEASPHSPSSISSSSRYSMPNATSYQISPPLRQATRLSSSPASSEGWSMNSRRRSPVGPAFQSSTLPPVLLSGAPSPTRRRSREEEPPLAHRYSHPSAYQDRGGQGSSKPAITTVNSAPALLTSLKRPRRWTSQADEGDPARARSPPPSPTYSPFQRPRAHSSDRAKQTGKATASPPQSIKPSHTEVMSRLNRKMRERLAIKAASASPTSSPPHTLTISGLTGPRISSSTSSTSSTPSSTPVTASHPQVPSPRKRQGLLSADATECSASVERDRHRGS